MSVNKSVFSPSKERAKTLNRIFQSALEKANQLHMDEPEFECGPIFVTDDTKIIQEGIKLTFNHLQKGRSTFSAYAKAMINDHGQYVIPYLKSCYLAVKFHPGAAMSEVMDNAVTVESFNLDSLHEADDAESTTNSDKLENVWLPAGVSLSAQKALMLQTSKPWQYMTSLTMPDLMYGKIVSLIREAQQDGLPVADLLEQVPGVSEMMLLELMEGDQGVVNLSAQIAESDVMEILISQVDYSKKATLNPEASEMILEQDLMSWIEDLNTALFEM